MIATLPFLGAILAALAGLKSRGTAAVTSGAVTALALLGILAHAPEILAGGSVAQSFDWLPALGLNAHFRLDGLSLLFSLLILGIGLLILLYAHFYLDRDEPAGRFFSFLLLFQGAMLGIVLSDNLLLLLVFWELTSLSSFLLIGWWRHLPEARQGARMALAITGGGGLAMIAGMLLLGRIAGSYELSVILSQRDIIQASPLYLPALLLILTGCFAKSAQFPFQFWLPHAMAAPTPVSAYLHSATMVKAGIYLMARLWPVLAGTEIWFYLVAGTGLITLLIGAKVALFKDDLKAILAYSTVSHLGLITFLLGLGTKAGAVAAMLHILCHASFKAALFMVAGIVDHEAGTRDIRRLGGLRRLMPWTFAFAAVAGLAMAGIPPLNGFLSKEMMLEEAAHTVWGSSAWLVPLLALVGAMLSVGYTFRLLAQGFLGPENSNYRAPPHDPGLGMLAAPAILVALVILTGLIPMASLGGLVSVAAGAVTGGPVEVQIKLWHGLQSPALWLSLAAVGGGLLIYGIYPTLQRAWEAVPKLEGKRLFDAAMTGLLRLSQRTADIADSGSITRAMAIAIAAILAFALWTFLGETYHPGTRAMTPVDLAPLVGWVVLMISAGAAVMVHRQRLLSLLLVGVVGLVIAVGFAYLSAPDLALTQITVEVVTIILMLLALNFLPKRTPAESRPSRRLRDAVLAGLAGLGTATLAYALMLREAAFSPISAFHLAQSKPGAGGTNAVNTIIVDFRGYDTYGEIIVLGIAALILFALTETLLAPGPAKDRLLATPKEPRAGDPHPLLLVAAMRLLLPIALMVGAYIYLRGHNQPGGGFVAGLIFAIALVLQYLASGQMWAEARLRMGYHAMIGTGVLIASACGIGSFVAGRPFLTSSYTHVHLWPLEEFELATAAIFDLGVFFCVLGAVMLSLSSLARLGQARGGQ